jgi:hypothetical protein
MQRNKAALETLFFQVEQVALSRVESMGINAFGFERSQYTFARHERNFTLSRSTPHEHCDFAKIERRSGHALPPIF